MINKLSKKQLWWLYGAFGALFLGSGVSIALEASHWKHQGESLLLWAGCGTLGIGLVVAGVVFLIRAGILDREIKKKRLTS